MSTKLQAPYVALFEKIKSIWPEFQPKLFINDFEKGLKNALRQVFSNEVKHVGRYFHYGNVSVLFFYKFFKNELTFISLDF